MKRFVFSMLSAWMLSGGLLMANPPENPDKDTLEVIFGEKSKMIIYVDQMADLEELVNYDLNSMIEDLKITLMEKEITEETLLIEDTSGTRYRRENREVKEERPEFRRLEQEFETLSGSKVESERNVQSPSSESTAPQKFRKPEKRTHQSTNFDFGFNNYLQNGKFPDALGENYGVRPWGSWYVGIHSNWQTRLLGPLSLQWGPSVSWYNFKLQDPSVRLFREDGMAEFLPLDPALNTIKSKLTVSYLGFSAVPMFDFGYKRKVKNVEGKSYKYWSRNNDGFRIGAGAYAGYRIGSYTKLVWRDGGRQRDRERDNFYLENLRYGLRGVVGFRGVDLFVNYDLNPLFANNRGPDLNAISFGITF